MRRKIIFGTLLIITYHLLFVLQANARTILIDGISPGKTFKIEQGKEALQTAVGNLGLTPEKREVSYLYKSELGKEILKNDPEGRAIVPWNGDALDKTEVNRAVDATVKSIEIIHEKGETINIVSHSYGTVIAYKALEKISTEHPDIKINTFITMGSPLGKGSIAQGLADIPLNGSLKTPQDVTNWLNYYSLGDNISGKINKEGVADIQVSGGHTSYYENSGLVNEITSDFLNPAKAVAEAQFNKIIIPTANSTIPMVVQQSQNQALQLTQNLSSSVGQVASDLAKQLSNQQVSLDSSKQAAYTPQSLVNTQTVYYTENIVGSWLSDVWHGSGGSDSWLETLRFNRDGTYQGTSSLGGQYGGTYTIDPPYDFSTPKALSFNVNYTNNQAGSFNNLGDHGRGLSIQSNKMTLTSNTSTEKLMINGYTKQ